MERKAVIALSVVLSVLALFSALGPVEAAPKGKAVCAVVTLQEQTVDPHKFTGALLTPIMVHLNAGLMRGDLEGKFVPGVVRSWKVSEDGLTWEFILRKDVKFWNGDPVTAEDVKFSIERFSRPEMKTPGSAVMSRYLKSVEIAGDDRLLLHATGTYPDFPRRVAGAYPVSKKYFDQVGEEAFAKSPMACGPFKLDKNAIGESFAMEAFDGFYDPDRVPRVKNMVLKIIPEASTRMAALKVGEVDLIEGVAGPMIIEVKNVQGCKTFASPRTASLFFHYLDAFKVPGSPFADKRVRQALNYAVDRQTIVKKLYFGEAYATIGPFWPTTIGFDPSMKPYPYDPEKAKKLLTEAGYPEGFETEIPCYVSSSTPLIPELSEAVAGYLKNAGIKAKVVQMEAGAYFGKWREKSLRGLGAISIPASSYFDGGMMLATHYITDGSYSYYSNRRLDDLADKQKTEMNDKVRDKLLMEACNVLWEDPADLYTISVNTVFAGGPKVKDWKLYASTPFVAGLEYMELND